MRQHGDEAFAVKRQSMEAIVDLAGIAKNADLAFACAQLMQHLLGGAVGDVEVDAGIGALEADDEVGQHAGLSVHMAQSFSSTFFILPSRLGAHARGFGLRLDGLDIGQHHAPEFGEMGLVALAVEEPPAELGLQRLDGARQRRLGDVAALRRAGEIQLPRQGEEIANLLHLHGTHPWPAASAHHLLIGQQSIAAGRGFGIADVV